MSNSDNNISTTTAALAERFGVSVSRITEAAKSAENVYGWQNGFIETDERGIENLKADLKNQLA